MNIKTNEVCKRDNIKGHFENMPVYSSLINVLLGPPSKTWYGTATMPIA